MKACIVRNQVMLLLGIFCRQCIKIVRLYLHNEPWWPSLQWNAPFFASLAPCVCVLCSSLCNSVECRMTNVRTYIALLKVAYPSVLFMRCGILKDVFEKYTVTHKSGQFFFVLLHTALDNKLCILIEADLSNNALFSQVELHANSKMHLNEKKKRNQRHFIERRK